MFGYLAFATSVQPSTKFDPRACKYIFLGYPNGQKAYKLYDLDTHKIFTSKDVTFREDIFPFQDTSSIPTNNTTPSGPVLPIPSNLNISIHQTKLILTQLIPLHQLMFHPLWKTLLLSMCLQLGLTPYLFRYLNAIGLHRFSSKTSFVLILPYPLPIVHRLHCPITLKVHDIPFVILFLINIAHHHIFFLFLILVEMWNPLLFQLLLVMQIGSKL